MSPARLRPPLWARWVLALGVGVIALVALIVFVDHNNNNAEATQSPAAVAQANRQAVIVIGQDQRPHVVALKSGVRPRTALVAAVRADMISMIDSGTIGGPLQRTGCTGLGARAGRLRFRCTAVASDVNYPFLGVVDVPTRQVTYCKRDLPPVPSMSIPVSRRCTA